MKAAVNTTYGPPQVVQIEEIETPIPGNTEVLIRVHATTVNRTDCGLRDPRPFFVRAFSGLRRPKNPVLGSEFAGDVAALGSGVTQFTEGDRVFGLSGSKFGAHAEYLSFRETGPLATAPANTTYEEAASICDGATLALNILRAGDVDTGRKKLLIYGASGAIGTAAVQLAKYFGADVTAVCSSRHVELVKSLGADHVIDYTQEDFTKNGQTYEVIFDAVGKASFSYSRNSLTPRGIYLSSDFGTLYQNPIFALLTYVTSKFAGRRAKLPLPSYNQDTIVFLKELVEAGELTPVIDRTYPLEDIVDAYEYVEEKRKTGNVVITVASD